MQLHRAHGTAPGGLQADLGLLLERWFTPKFRPFGKYLSENKSKFWWQFALCEFNFSAGSLPSYIQEWSVFGIREPFAKLWTPRLYLAPVSEASVSRAQQGSGRVVPTAGNTTLIFRTKTLYKTPHSILEIWQSASNLTKIPWNLRIFFFWK